MSVTAQQVRDALAKVVSPRGAPLPEAGVLSDIVVNDGKVFFSINVDAAEAKTWEDVRAKADAAVRALPGVTSSMIALTAERRPGGAAAPHSTAKARQGVPPVSSHRPPQNPQGSPMGKQAPVPGVGAIIAVASGKGGVGKSTTALNLALGLRDLGLRVGVLDADIYGPSMPKLTGIREKPQLNDAKRMIPIMRFGLAIMSIGFLVEEDTPMIWRGPMVTQALQQLLNETAWDNLDYLIIDLPPGTGDIQLTLCQRVPVSGAIIVTTPQDIALLDARKALKMFEKVEVPVLGIVENMAIHVCTKCGHAEHVFGQGGGESMAKQYGVPLLGSLPLAMHIREEADRGEPTVATAPGSDAAERYRDIARSAAARLSQRSRNKSIQFPNIVIQNT